MSRVGAFSRAGVPSCAGAFGRAGASSRVGAFSRVRAFDRAGFLSRAGAFSRTAVFVALAAATVIGVATPPPVAAQSAGPITIGRLQYDGGGDWYANPSSLPNLLEAVRERTGIPTAQRDVAVRPSDPGLRDYPFLYMTGHGNVRFSPEERLALRRHLLDGGFLHADDNYGLDESFREEMGRVFPDRELVELPANHPIFQTPYGFPNGLPKIHEHDGHPPQAFGIHHRGRLIVLYTFETDLGDGWEDADVHEDPPEVREDALRMGVNIFVHALTQAVP